MFLFPFRALADTERKPYANWVIIALNVLVFLFVQGAGRWIPDFHPYLGLRPMGYNLLMLWPGEHFSAWQFLTSMFLHGSIVHLLSNMVFLWVFGNLLNAWLGHWRFVMGYLLAGVIAAVAHTFTSELPLLGASGAVMGVSGMFLFCFPTVRIQMFVWILFLFRIVAVPAFMVILYYVSLDLFYLAMGWDSGVAHWAHFGGFASGILVVAIGKAVGLFPATPHDLFAWFKGDRESEVEQQYRKRTHSPPPSSPLRRAQPSQRLEECLRLGGSNEEILSCYQRLLDEESEVRLSDAHEAKMYDLLLSLEKFRAAISQADRYLALYPEGHEAQRIAMRTAFLLADRLDQSERAIPFFERALSLGAPDGVRSYLAQRYPERFGDDA